MNLRSPLTLGLFAFLFLALLPSLAFASGCGTLPSGISALITSCIPVNIVNSQTSATPTGFQQMLSSFPTNALQGNFVVYNSLSGSLLNAWVESNSVVWVNLGSNTIAGSSSANGIYDIGYGSSSTNFFVSGNDIGEAPQLSSTYAEYDDGASVFNYYQAWGSLSSLPSGYTNGGVTLAFNPTYTAISSAQSSTDSVYSNSYYSQSSTPFIFDFYATTSTSASTFVGLGPAVNLATCADSPNGLWLTSTWYTYVTGDCGVNNGATITSSPTTALTIFNVYYASSTQLSAGYNYGSLTLQNSESQGAYTYFGIMES